jgi:urease accessory protein
MTQPVVPRSDPVWYLPADLPEEITALESSVQGGLGVGAPGKVGLLDVTLAAHHGVTRVQRQYLRAPLHIYRPIYLDPHQPGMVFIFTQQSGDGFVQGDRYCVDFDCAPGLAAHITTQAATKVYTARQNFLTQLVNLRAGAGAVLEYLPDPVVPFCGSRLFQRTCVTADRDSTVMLSDALLPGRVAHGEAHAYALYWAETEFRQPDGTLLVADVLRLHPAAGDDPKLIGLLGSYDALATLYIITRQADPTALVCLMRSALVACTAVLAGATELPHGCGTAVRLLGNSSTAVQAALRSVWSAACLELLGAPAPNLRQG